VNKLESGEYFKREAGWFSFGTTPSAPVSVASHLFLYGTATPPDSGGELSPDSNLFTPSEIPESFNFRFAPKT
jgi:hypothetical protein